MLSLILLPETYCYGHLTHFVPVFNLVKFTRCVNVGQMLITNEEANLGLKVEFKLIDYCKK